MARQPSKAKNWSDPLLITIAGVAILLAAGLAVLAIYGQPGRVLTVVPGIVQSSVLSLIVEALAIGFIAFSRYRVLPQPEPYWIGVADASYTIGGLLIALTFPFTPQGSGIIARLPNTSAWLIWSTNAFLVIFLLAGTVVRWPRPGQRAARWWAWVAAGTLLAVAALSLLMVALERWLPLLVTASGKTPLRDPVYVPLIIITTAGAVLYARRYRRTGDVLAGFASLTELFLLAQLVCLILSAVRFDLAFYIYLALLYTSPTVLLFGLLWDYVGLYRREQERTEELAALQQITDPALGQLGLDALVQSLLQRTLAIMHADTGALMLLDPASQELAFVAREGIPGDEIVGPRVAVGADFAGRVAAQEGVLWVRDVQADLAFSTPLIRASGIHTMIGAPLRARDRLLGVVFVGFLQARDIGGDEERLLSVVAERAALAIDQARLLEDERRARLQAEEAVRSRDRFLETAAHELKTPITNLRGYAQTAVRRLEREGAPDPARTRRALDVIDQQSDRLARLEQQLLDIADIENGQLQLRRQETDLVPLLSELVANTQASTKRHTITFGAPPSLVADVDPLRIEQVVANLLDNAVKFGKADTAIEVELSAPAPGAVQISVRDHGPGVPPERRAQLFDRYYQVQRERPFAGLGLGLYYGRRIVELHGGTIRAEFPADGGSRFVVTLPVGEPVVLRQP